MEEIKVKEFKTALEVVKPGLASKEKIEQTSSFAFLEDKVVTYNDEIYIQHPLKGIPLRGAIKAEELYKFLSKIKTEKINLDIDEDKVTVKSGRAKVEFTLEAEITLPIDDKKLVDKGKWRELPENFIEAVSMAKGSCSRDRTDPKLLCVHLNKKGIIEGSDGFRILQYDLGTKLPIDSVLIPATSITSVANINPIEITSSEEWVHFRNANKTIISCRILAEDYVDTSRFIDTDEKGVKLILPSELSEVLDTAEIFASEGDVDLTVKKKKLIIRAKSETAAFKDELDLEKAKSEFTFSVAPYLLRGILKQVQSCTIYSDRLLFKGDSWKYATVLSSDETEEE